MGYLGYLQKNRDRIQSSLEAVLKKYKVQPVGDGYIDLIVSNELVEAFINELVQNNIVILGIAWWCHCTTESELLLGCPHGMGGPRSIYFQGWFSETQIPMYKIPKQVLYEINLINLHDEVNLINSRILQFIKNEFKKDESYLECLVPALWLYVPNEWRRI